MTQERFAEEIMGVSLKYLQRIEAGRENVTIRSLVKLANRIGVPVGRLFDMPKDRRVRRGRPKGPKE